MSDAVAVPKNELQWLLQCSDIEMMDGDTARDMVEAWLNNGTAREIIELYSADPAHWDIRK